MNISRENIDDLNAVITLKITEEDYSPKVDDVLKDYKKKARIDGFRPGMVPMGMIRKLYYKPILAEEINKMVGEKLMAYIRDEKIKILGEPLPHDDGDKTIDFDTDKEFEFSFDIGLYPELSTTVSEDDKIPFYTIRVDDEMIDKAMHDVTHRFGELEPVDTFTGDEVLEGNIFQSDQEGSPVENGISVENVSFSAELVKDKKNIKTFEGKKAGDSVSFNLKEAYEDDEKIKSLLRIPKDEEVDLDGFYTLEIKEIKRFKEHEINQELFDKVYGEGVVKSEEEFRNRIKDEITGSYARESEYRFTIDARDFYLKKINFDLPVDFLKRWLVEANENMTEEQIEKDFTEFEEDFKWQIIKDQITRANEIRVSEQEMLEYAISVTKNQFYGYGMYNVPDEYMEKYAREQLANPESSKKMYEQRITERVFAFIRETVKTEEEEVSLEEFKKLFEEEVTKESDK